MNIYIYIQMCVDILYSYPPPKKKKMQAWSCSKKLVLHQEASYFLRASPAFWALYWHAQTRRAQSGQSLRVLWRPILGLSMFQLCRFSTNVGQLSQRHPIFGYIWDICSFPKARFQWRMRTRHPRKSEQDQVVEGQASMGILWSSGNLRFGHNPMGQVLHQGSLTYFRVSGGATCWGMHITFVLLGSGGRSEDLDQI